ncbi:cyclic nucleotide-binding protein [Pelobium manganitolerans]|uniref:Cyclic nucleotide-binding protein n=1 Tax=Pelobium manganitolerans TaxID=1842495 RepID=A0A419S5L5_9SPHI|nr:Crp/Fnr family transcriptional regulator [Pelobium manganitolerans]RKD16132.1 cyclic nucleotide-binding protein [Pelobium manganitolerans]
MGNPWTKFAKYFKPLNAAPKTILLNEGDIARQMFFIEKGALRTWVNNDGKEITTQFFFEGNSVASIESFRLKKPSLYSIETLEPCTLQCLSADDFNQVLEQNPALKTEMEDHLFKRLFQAQQLFYSFLKNSPQKRYEDLIAQHPELIKRVPQHYIASYLGITSVSLSRIRNRKS